jgi:hypothetical protein
MAPKITKKQRNHLYQKVDLASDISKRTLYYLQWLEHDLLAIPCQ